MKTEEAVSDLRSLSVDFRGQVVASWLDIMSVWLFKMGQNLSKEAVFSCDTFYLHNKFNIKWCPAG